MSESHKNWRLALVICLYKDWIMSHCSCWPSTTPERAQGRHQEWGRHSVLWENGTTSLHIDIFRHLEPNSCISSYLERHQNPSWKHLLLMISTNLQETSSKRLWNMCLIACTSPLHQNHIHTYIPPYLFGRVFQSYLKCCLPDHSPHFTPNKTYLTTLRLCIFFKLAVSSVSFSTAQDASRWS